MKKFLGFQEFFAEKKQDRQTFGHKKEREWLFLMRLLPYIMVSNFWLSSLFTVHGASFSLLLASVSVIFSKLSNHGFISTKINTDYVQTPEISFKTLSASCTPGSSGLIPKTSIHWVPSQAFIFSSGKQVSASVVVPSSATCSPDFVSSWKMSQASASNGLN